jgi:hypothetical protein
MKFSLCFLTGFAVSPGITALTLTTPSFKSNWTSWTERYKPIAAQVQSFNTSLGIQPRNGSFHVRAEDIPDSTWHPACGLKRATPKEWTANYAEIKNFTQTNFKNFDESGHDDFVIHLRDRYAKKVAASSLSCEPFGWDSKCSIGSCLNLDEDIPVQERQIAYFVFEQISGYFHLLQRMKRATLAAGETSMKKIPVIVQSHVSPDGIWEQGDHLMPRPKIFEDGEVETWLIDYARVIHQNRIDRAKLIGDETRHFIKGAPNSNKKTVVDLLTASEFIVVDEGLTQRMIKLEEEWFEGMLVGAVWMLDRPYLLDVDAPPGGCELDRRGHKDYRTCLPEYPDRSFWLFAIDGREENESWSNHQGYVKGPTNFYAFPPERALPPRPYISREDIVRSSLFGHRKKLNSYHNPSTRLLMGGVFNYTEFNEPSEVGKVPGAFGISVCRNPAGEAISSVWSKKARNYPCMCGEFTWSQGWSIEKDETPRFLTLTQFMYSEDWEDYCSSENKCIGHDDIDLHAILDAHREPNDKETIPWQLKHPFVRCEKPRGHRTFGNPEKDRNYRDFWSGGS